MTTLCSLALVACLVLLFAPLALAQASPANEKFHDTTDWQVVPSPTFDALCLINILSGDAFYLTYYQSDFDALSPRLTPAARAALAALKRKIKDEKGNIPSAFLTLYFSAVEHHTLDDLLAILAESGPMQAALRKTSYYSDSGWHLYESVRPDLKTYLLWLKEIQFESYWQQQVRPRLERKLVEIQAELPRYNIVPRIERALGSPLPSDRITVFLLQYSQPHGIRITGTRFLTDVAWPFRIVLRNAVHEMMHPPYDLAADADLRAALDRLRKDSFLMDRVRNHNSAFGYNSFEGFVEEDCVQALEQALNDGLGIAQDPRQRWKASDDGMHVLAVALYSLMQQENFASGRESLRAFLIRMARSGRLAPGRIQPLYDAFYAASP